MDRRSFLKGMAGILASGFAPAVVGSNVLMPIKQIEFPRIVGIDYSYGKDATSIYVAGKDETAIFDLIELVKADVDRICGLTPEMIDMTRTVGFGYTLPMQRRIIGPEGSNFPIWSIT